MDIKKGVGKKIQELRKICGMTQEQLAEIIGIETISMSKIETGRSYPTSENLAKIAKVLNVEPFEFYMFTPQKSDEEIIQNIQSIIKEIAKDSKKLNILYNIVKGMAL